MRKINMASYVPGPGALWEKFAGLTETDGPQTAGPFNEFFTGPALLCGERFGASPPPPAEPGGDPNAEI